MTLKIVGVDNYMLQIKLVLSVAKVVLWPLLYFEGGLVPT